PRTIDLHRHLVGCTADALGANLDRRLDVFHRLGEDVDRVGVGHALLDLVEGAVEDAHRGRLLALPHETVDELAGQLRAIARIRLERLGAGRAFRHGRFTPFNSPTAAAPDTGWYKGPRSGPCRWVQKITG